MKPSHCQGCMEHHSAGRKLPNVSEAKYNNWCCAQGKPAPDAVGHCRVVGLKRVAYERVAVS